ncbi:uncharacterized protein LOC134442619 [Engraulis encrasicolus]|uniref:uncharacterized protein LOC134442619 n=1 Tax=Engraulis encrasicolus TaxID=184585 RepID=UPI002FD65005
MDHLCFTLFRGPKRIRMKAEDMTVDKISRIFQVAPESVYLTDDVNEAIFPLVSGEIPGTSLIALGHYEVQGLERASSNSTPLGPTPSFSFSPSSSSSPTPFSFSASTSASGPRTLPPPRAGHFGSRSFQRSINVGEISGSRLVTSKTLVVRFSEGEANVSDMTAKVKDAMGRSLEEGPIVLTDSQGNALQDTEGTRTSQYWRQNSRQIFALTEEEMEDLQDARRAKVSRREDPHGALLGRAEEVKVAGEGLENIAKAMRHLSEVASAHLQRPSLQPAKEAMTCLVCKAIFVEPQFAACCGSLVGCKLCVETWCANSDTCLKCRAEGFAANLYAVRGLAAAADFFSEFEVPE